MGGHLFSQLKTSMEPGVLPKSDMVVTGQPQTAAQPARHPVPSHKAAPKSVGQVPSAAAGCFQNDGMNPALHKRPIDATPHPRLKAANCPRGTLQALRPVQPSERTHTCHLKAHS